MSEPIGSEANSPDAIEDQENLDIFEECFMHEVESWFTADIACCDNCHDDFVARWPYAFSADEAKFQCESIPLSAFYSGSRMHDWYTEEQFERMLPTIQCPNCGESLTHNMWPYNLPFTPPDNYEFILTELAYRASETPFLLLDYPFCTKVRDAIGDVSTKCSPSVSNDFLFRGRSFSEDANPSILDFDFPPAEYVKEGRYNHAGDSVLYLASSEEVCKAEMRHASNLYIAKFRFPASLKILDLMVPHQDVSEHADILSFIVFSALLSAKSRDKGFSRPEYVFSRFVKDCAKSVGFDAIRYPSTQMGTARFNLVVINREMTLANHAADGMVFRSPANNAESQRIATSDLAASDVEGKES